MVDSLSFVDLNARLGAGDDDASARAFELYAHRLIDLARTRLEDKLRDQVEADELLQSVLHSFFRRVACGKTALADWNSLWTIPVILTLRKGGSPDDLAREPLNEEAAQLVGILEEVQRGFDPEDRHIVVLCLQGLKPPEVSAELQVTERRVHRVLERVRARLQRLGDVE